MTTNTYTEFSPCRGYLPINYPGNIVDGYIDILRFHLNDNEMYLRYDKQYNQFFTTWNKEMNVYPAIQGKYQIKTNVPNINGLQSIKSCYIDNGGCVNNTFYLNNVGTMNPANNVWDYNQSYEAQDVTFYMSDGTKTYFCKFDFNLQGDRFINGQMLNFLTLMGFTNYPDSVEILLT